jgi:phosphoenolpyruvate carboxykinase (ATP)
VDFNLLHHGINVRTIHRNLVPAKLYEEAVRGERGSAVAENGALVVDSGRKTGRSPKDKRVVKHTASAKDIWWGPVNFPLDEMSFMINRERAKDYLNTRNRDST